VEAQQALRRYLPNVLEFLSHRRRWLLDWIAPLGILVIGVVNVTMHAHTRAYPGRPWTHLLYLTAAVIALGVRRRAPLTASVAVLGIATAWGALWPGGDQGPFEGFLLLVAAAYTIGAASWGRRLPVAAGVLAGYFVAAQVILYVTGGYLGDFLPVLVWMGAAWLVGLVLNRRSQDALQARATAETLLVDQERRTAAAVEQERSRIARELHDVVAHSLSVIVVQAAAERRSLTHGKVDPESVESVLASVEKTGREALVDLRRLLGLLRQVDDGLALAPQPSLAQLDALIGQVRDAGVSVQLDIDGSPATLPAGVDLTAYRIVQESLTNVLKHAHASHVDVQMRYRPRALDISVSDDGGGGRAESLGGSGNGLLGMRERALVFGGSVSAGPRATGGWEVVAHLPLEVSTLEPV
jgi:signal transduction histidine kinase